jgi:hypothetical protein
MKIIRAEEYEQRVESIPPFRVHIISYRLGDEFHCTVDNVNPGAVIARSHAPSRAEAEAKALERAIPRLEFSASRIQP